MKYLKLLPTMFFPFADNYALKRDSIMGDCRIQLLIYNNPIEKSNRIYTHKVGLILHRFRNEKSHIHKFYI